MKTETSQTTKNYRMSGGNLYEDRYVAITPETAEELRGRGFTVTPEPEQD